MIYFAGFVVVAAIVYCVHLCTNHSYRAGYDRGYSDADFQAEDTNRQILSLRLAVTVAETELERLRDELLRRDAHSFVNSI
jgi:hypothetical protein